MYDQIIETLQGYADSGKAVILQRFFKTGKGEYGEGDIFIGVKMPEIRKTANVFTKESTFEDLDRLLRSGIHEYRMTALIIVVNKFTKARDDEDKASCIEYYLANRQYINNWDFVDVTCYKILGPWFFTRDRSALTELASSDDLWSKRIAVITTMYFIKHDDYADTLRFADMMLDHPHDLIHKAVGWMLREIGKRDMPVEEEFLKVRYHQMPRTMLRYAIEKFPEEQRRAYLHGTV